MAFDPNANGNATAGMAPQQPQPGAPSGDASQNQMPMQQSQMPPEQQPQQEDQSQDDDPQIKAVMMQMDAAIENKNLAEKMKGEELAKIGECVHKGYKADLESCADWLKNNRDWLEMSLLTRKNKTFPWVGASNIKYPLLATASMQFSARAYPTLVPSDGNLVKTRIIGYDPDGSRADKADRISKHMSYQIMYRDPRWEDDMDKLLVVTSLAGTCFKKTYKDTTLNTVVSALVYPENLIVNYWANSLEQAYRKTEIVPLVTNEYRGRVNAGYFRDIGELGDASAGQTNDHPAWQKPRANDAEPSSEVDSATPHIFLECHTFYDLDEDGYEEPVVITIHEITKKVVRITARFASDSIHLDPKSKKVVCIEPLEYYTAFPFFSNPDGSIYGLGLGALLGPINEAVNTLANQLIDSGTLNNLQGGFIGKGLRIQMKELKMRPGEWVAVNATGDDLKNGIFPLETKEPSNVLLELMNLLITSGKELASVSDMMVGKMPGQNTPATTTQTADSEAAKVFTAVYKRLYNALESEFRKRQRINSLSPDILAEESKILNIQIQTSDYDGSDHDIIPAADPSGSSQQTQFSQLQQIGQQLLPLQVIDPREFAMRSLKLSQIANPEKLILQPQPPAPDPKAQTEQLKQQTLQQKAQQDAQAKQQDMQDAQQKMQLDMQMKQAELAFEEKRQAMDMQFKAMELKFKMAEHAMDLQLQKQEGMMELHRQALEHKMAVHTTAVTHKQKVDNQEEMNAIKQKNEAKNGATKSGAV